ncbi:MULTISPECIES: hypothetical protein [unclassified Pseudoxanthomonas]|uniref:hypothetical protein n=1 Tax=unclassified Pseudoxanthomonas TaxID=2645906 RepID=UPI001607C644|nr:MULTISPECIES: hypothetical protein [unclassified Pseudoxanthomonas]MBB3276026.1 hypothetical protein [Pseudoxanthomonas sp. OG2]MBV7472893.1 hypothetical protein [Pseudoxanthomonas sp. PXM05]
MRVAKRFLFIALLCLAATVSATSVVPKPLAEMVREADHVVVATITRVDMVDGKGRLLTDPESRTGPGLANQMRLHLEVHEVIATRLPPVSRTIRVPLWMMWHYELGTMQKHLTGQRGIFLLTGRDYQPVYPANFQRSLDERAEIQRLLEH